MLKVGRLFYKKKSAFILAIKFNVLEETVQKGNLYKALS